LIELSFAKANLLPTTSLFNRDQTFLGTYFTLFCTSQALFHLSHSAL
jgi:hypothetical protein